MDLNRKKLIIYISAGIIILGVIGFILYRFLFPAQPAKEAVVPGRISGGMPSASGGITTPQTPEEQIRPETLKPGEEITVMDEQKLTRITDFPVIAPSLNKDEDKVLFYKKDGGDLWSSDFTGLTQEKISNITIVGMIEAIWSPVRDRAAIFYLDNESKKGFLHIGTSSVTILPQDIKSFSWSPDGKNIAYLTQKNDRLNLNIADSSAKNPKTIFTSPILDSQINWVTADKIAFQTAPSGFAEGFLFAFSRSAGTFNKIKGPLFGLDSLWSSDGSRILVNFTNTVGRNFSAGIINSAGKEEFLFNSPTLAQKCVWADAKNMYCAVPKTVNPNTIWPDEYLRGEVNTSDRLVLIDLDQKAGQTIFNEGEFDISNLTLTKNKSHLFFVNRADGSLWVLKLKIK